MRRLFHLGVAILLLVTAALAPLSHTHEGDPYHLHAEGFGHLHLDSHDCAGPEWHAADKDGARFQDWLAGDGKTKTRAVAVTEKAPALPAPVMAEARVAAPDTSPGDPPWLRSLPPRSPPV